MANVRTREMQNMPIRFAELYQQLGMLWEFLGLQCRHWDGYRRNHSGTMLCRICGKLKGADEYWLLLPRKGNKSIGSKTIPTSDETFPHKRAAVMLSDSISFHGVQLSIDVQNAYRSRLLDRDITIASDRIVRFEEGGVECMSDTHTLRIKLRARDQKSGLPYSAFPSELPRKLLKLFPILLEYDTHNRSRRTARQLCLHLSISGEKEAGSVEIAPNVTVELNDKGELIGVEILEASRFVRDTVLHIGFQFQSGSRPLTSGR